MRRSPFHAAVLIAVAACASACDSRTPTSAAVAPPGSPSKGVEPSAAAPSPAAAATPPGPQSHAVPTSVDLRPRLTELGLTPRPQGPRSTCSIFTTCSAIEVAVAKRTGAAVRLSPEYLNWAAGKAARHASDGNFFHNAIAGFEAYGLCTEAAMPYQPAFDPQREPSAEAAQQGARLREQANGTVVFRWIVPWAPDRFGVSEEQFAEIKRVLAAGYPVAAGSGHSRLLVGYRDDAKLPGGGAFITEDSALSRFDEVPYDFVRKQVADVFWVEALAPTPKR